MVAMFGSITKTCIIIIILEKMLMCSAGMVPYIVGGALASINKFPHSAFLEVNCHETWVCGSAILNQRVIITAGHCVSGCAFRGSNTSDTVTVLAGHSNLKKVPLLRNVIHIKVHEDFNDNTMENDVALALVDRDFPLGAAAKRVVISQVFPEDRTGYVAGWGVTSDKKPQFSSNDLKFLGQNLRTKKFCSIIGHMHEGMFCAGAILTSAGYPDRGDSGSAMVIQGYHQIGIVSFRIQKYPALSVYTNVSYYYSWIKHNAKLLYCISRQ